MRPSRHLTAFRSQPWLSAPSGGLIIFGGSASFRSRATMAPPRKLWKRSTVSLSAPLLRMRVEQFGQTIANEETYSEPSSAIRLEGVFLRPKRLRRGLRGAQPALRSRTMFTRTSSKRSGGSGPRKLLTWLSVGILSIPSGLKQLERPDVFSSILLWNRNEVHW